MEKVTNIKEFYILYHEKCQNEKEAQKIRIKAKYPQLSVIKRTTFAFPSLNFRYVFKYPFEVTV